MCVVDNNENLYTPSYMCKQSQEGAKEGAVFPMHARNYAERVPPEWGLLLGETAKSRVRNEEAAEVKTEEGSGSEKKWIWGKCQDSSAIKLPCHHRNKGEGL